MEKTQAYINSMIRSKRIKLSLLGYFDHFKIPIFLMIIPGFTLYTLIDVILHGQKPGSRTPAEMFWVTTPFLFASAIMFYLRWRKLRFIEIRSVLSGEIFSQTIKNLIDSHQLSTHAFDTDYFIGFRKASFIDGTNNDTIFILRTPNSVLINSSQSKKTINDFNSAMRLSTLPEESMPENMKVEEKEWTWTSTIKRIGLYTICFLLIFLASVLIRESKGLFAIIISTSILILCAGYIVLDLWVLFSKKSKQVE